MGSISTQVPESQKIPLFYATVDGSMAGNLTQNQAALLVGQMNTTGANAGTVTTMDTPIAIGSPALGTFYFGAGSMLDRMIQAFFNSNTGQMLYAAAVADPSAGEQATGSITIATAPTASGTLFVTIAGQLVQVAVGSTDIVGTVATNLAAAINAMVQLPVTATVASAEVTLTCNWKGLTGNDITIIPNFQGPNSGQVFPKGLTLTVVAMSGGTSEPVFTNLITNIAAFPYLYVGLPYTDTASELAWNTEYGFASGGRWNYSRQQYGQIFNAVRDGYSDAITFGNGGPNAPQMSTMVIEPLTPSPVWEVAAGYVANAALGFSDDPARPLQTLELIGIVPASQSNRFSQAEINNLANSGLAVQAVAPNGNMAIMVEQTTYLKNAYGQGDTAFGLCTVLSTLAYILANLKASITSKYPRSKLVASGTAFGPGQAIVTPAMIQAELVAEYQGLVYDGVAQDLPSFIKNLIVQIDSVNPNRVNVLFPPTLAGQLRIFAALAQFRLLAATPANL
jgi:phage tail sheath gpL-like